MARARPAVVYHLAGLASAELPVAEDAPLAPQSPYTVSKAATDLLAACTRRLTGSRWFAPARSTTPPRD